MVGDKAEALRRDGHALNEIAILVRTSAQTRSFEERMLTLGLPYRVVGGLRFYERQEIRDAVAYMRVLQSPADDLGFERIINLPRRGVGDVALRAMHAVAAGSTSRCTRPPTGSTQDGTLKGRPAQSVRELLDSFAAGARCWARGPRAHRGRHAGRERLRGDVEAGQVAGGAGPAGEPQGADAGARRSSRRCPASSTMSAW